MLRIVEDRRLIPRDTRLVLSASIGRFTAQLNGWSGTRLGQDTI